MSVKPETPLQFCTFRCAGRLFGIELCELKEITATLELTPIFHADRPVRGLLNLRGRIMLVVDCARLLGLEPSPDTARSRIVIVKEAIAERVGLLVDEVCDVQRIPAGLIEDRRQADAQHQGAERRSITPCLSRGVCRLKEQLMVVLDTTRILDCLGQWNESGSLSEGASHEPSAH